MHDVSPGAASAFFSAEGFGYLEGRVPPARLAVAGGLLAFVADDATHGRELWVSNGTDEGTLLVHDVAPGDASSDPEYPISVGPMLFFTADQEATGNELWAARRSDVSPPCVGDCDGDWQVGVAHLVKGVRIALGADGLASCPSMDRNADARITVDELLTGVQNLLEGCRHLVQRFPPTVALPVPTATPTVGVPPSPTQSATPPETPGQPHCLRTGCSGQVCAPEPAITDCRWVAEYGCLRAARCELSPDGCGFVFERGAAAHRCLIALGRCVFDDDCAVTERCRYDLDAWGSCVRDGMNQR